MTVDLIIGILALILGVIIFLACLFSKSKQYRTVLIIYACLSSIVGIIGISKELGKRHAYIQSLKGNNPYKIEIRYQLADSLYVPVDTTYVLVD